MFLSFLIFEKYIVWAFGCFLLAVGSALILLLRFPRHRPNASYHSLSIVCSSCNLCISSWLYLIRRTNYSKHVDWKNLRCIKSKSHTLEFDSNLISSPLASALSRPNLYCFPINGLNLCIWIIRRNNNWWRTSLANLNVNRLTHSELIIC